MTREESIGWIIAEAKPYGLEWECLQTFNHYCNSDEKFHVDPIDYYQHASDALYEWDI